MVLLLGVLHINHTFRNFLFFGKKIKGMAFNKQIAHSTPIFANIQLLKIDDIRQLQLVTFVYNCQNELALTYFRHYFAKCLHMVIV